jgi:hypothetical protein
VITIPIKGVDAKEGKQHRGSTRNWDGIIAACLSLLTEGPSSGGNTLRRIIHQLVQTVELQQEELGAIEHLVTEPLRRAPRMCSVCFSNC